MGQTIKQGACKTLRAESFGPFIERQVAGHHGGTPDFTPPLTHKTMPNNGFVVYYFAY
jgi:hypothetical protein